MVASKVVWGLERTCAGWGTHCVLVACKLVYRCTVYRAAVDCVLCALAAAKLCGSQGTVHCDARAFLTCKWRTSEARLGGSCTRQWTAWDSQAQRDKGLCWPVHAWPLMSNEHKAEIYKRRAGAAAANAWALIEHGSAVQHEPA